MEHNANIYYNADKIPVDAMEGKTPNGRKNPA